MCDWAGVRTSSQGRQDLIFSRSLAVVLPVQEEAFQWCSVGEAFIIITHAMLIHREYGRLPSHGCAQNPSPKEEFSQVLLSFKHCILPVHILPHTFWARSCIVVKLLVFFWWPWSWWTLRCKLLLTTLKLLHHPWQLIPVDYTSLLLPQIAHWDGRWKAKGKILSTPGM